MRILSVFILLSFVIPGFSAESKTKAILIKMQRGQMRYKVESIFAKPGEKLRITLDNNDEIQHNLVICAKGRDNWKAVADATLKLGEKMMEKEFVPDSPLVLAATKLVDPGKSDTINFAVPDEEGIYPYVCTFPGHSVLMRGELIVANSKSRITDLRYDYFEGAWKSPAEMANAEPVASGKLEKNRISLNPSQRKDGFGFVYTANVEVPLAAEYKFHLASDDGSQLLIDGKPVVSVEGGRPIGDLKTGKVQLEAGSHRLELRYVERGGNEELRFGWSGPGFKYQALTDPRFFKPEFKSEEMLLDPVSGIMVVRCNMPDAPARALAVGTPEGIHYCFDPTTCRILYAWAGDFLDVGPERGDGKGRGGKVCKVLGDIVHLSDGEKFPLLFTDEKLNTAVPEFLGYKRLVKSTKFLFQINGVGVEQTVSIQDNGNAAIGTSYVFDREIEGPVAARLNLANCSVVSLSFGGGAHAEGDELITWPTAKDGISMMIFPKAP